MKKAVLILLMLFCVSSIYSQGDVGSSRTRKNYVLRFEEREMDDSPNTINLDSVQLADLYRFLTDTCGYYKRDSILLSSLNLLRNSINRRGEHDHTENWVRIMLFALAFLLAACGIYLFVRFQGLSSAMDELEHDKGATIDYYKLERRLEDSVSKNLFSSSKAFDKEIEKMESKISVLENRLELLENTSRKYRKESEVQLSDYSTPISQSIESVKLLYSDSIIDRVFSHVLENENDDTVFVLRLKNETNASFTISKRAYGKVIANPSFLDGCDKQILGKNSVEIVNEGEAEKRINGKWTVTSPLKVEIR